MKNTELKQLMRDVLKEELHEMFPQHPDDAAEEMGDGFGNE